MWTWAQFNNAVYESLLDDANRLNTNLFVRQAVAFAVRDLQRVIPYYQQGHSSLYGIGDVERVGSASKGPFPEGLETFHDAFFIKTGYVCVRQPMTPFDWAFRHDMICGRLGCYDYIGRCKPAITVDPHAKEFIVAPRVTDGRQVEINWSGVKSDFNDTDTVPFDQDMAYAVSLYVQGIIALRIKREPQMADYYLNESLGLYPKERRKLFASKKGKRIMVEHRASPMEVITECGPCSGSEDTNADGVIDSDDVSDEAIEWVAFGDSGELSSIADTEKVANLVKELAPDFVIHLGDCAYPSGRPSTIQPYLVKFYDAYIPSQYYQVFGNHDTDTDSGAYLLHLLTNVHGLSGGNLYYKFSRGPVTFFSLFSGGTGVDDLDDDQADWLEAGLAEATTAWKVVLIHKPPYSSDILYTPGITEWRLPFKSWGADLVVSGHAHSYERLQVDQTPYIINGLGGATKRGFGSVHADSQVRYYAKNGVLRMTATATHLQSVLYTVDKEIIDNVSFYK